MDGSATRKQLLLVYTLFLIVGIGPGIAGTIYVDKNASGTGNGSSWVNAYNSISSAISDANYGDQIWVASAIYQELITLKNGVAIYGGFEGNETEFNQRDYNTHITVIDANYAGTVVTITDNADPNTRVDGFLIRHGDNFHGGGMRIIVAAPVIANNVIAENKSNGLGGGIYCYGYNTLTNAEATIIGNAIVDNLAYDTEGNGGGIACHGSSPTIANNVIVRNIANRNGGGISCWASESEELILSSSPVISNNFILANAANVLIGDAGSNVGGGGIHCTATDLDGSPIQGAVCEAQIINNVIAANGGWLGGGICAVDSILEGAVSIINNTIVANNGSGIFWQNTSPTIANNLVAYNTWGLEQVDNEFTDPNIKNNCVYGNSVKAEVSDFKGLSDPIGTNGNICMEPKMAAYLFGNFHIQPDSPCVNAGDMNSIETDWTDIEGQNRVSGLAVDIGADESDGTVWNITANIIYVKSDGNDTNGGLSWAMAKKTLTAGIDAAASTYGEIWVAAGTYKETIKLPAFVYLYGGFDGTENSRNQRDIQGNQTVIDANETGCVVTTINCGYLVSRLDGFTVENGSPLIVGTDLIERGGGIWTTSCSPVITNNIIQSNQADDPMWSFLLDGGGLSCYLSYPSITSNSFIGNKVNNYTVGKGGGIYSNWSMPTIVNNIITENTAREGPAIYAEKSEPYIANNAIYLNSGPAFYGASKGAVRCYICDYFIITHNIIANNVASIGAGINAEACFGGRIQNNLICWNQSYEVGTGMYGAGGGIYFEVSQNPNSTFVITNNTIAGNTASSLVEHQGGGIALAVLSDKLVVANNIIAFNSSGIWSYIGSLDVPTLKNNCVYNPTGSNYIRVTPGPNDVSIDPNFVDLYGGNFHLTGSSPMIDAGDNNAVPADLTFDGDGFPRFIDDLRTADTGAGTAPVVDIGVYEFLRSDINGDGGVNFEDYATFAPHWLETGCDNCDGAELTGDGQVTVEDLKEFVKYWLAGS